MIQLHPGRRTARRRALLLLLLLLLLAGCAVTTPGETGEWTPYEFVRRTSNAEPLFVAADGSFWTFLWEDTDAQGRDGVHLEKIGPSEELPPADSVNEALKITVTGLQDCECGTDVAAEPHYVLQYALEQDLRIPEVRLVLQICLQDAWYNVPDTGLWDAAHGPFDVAPQGDAFVEEGALHLRILDHSAPALTSRTPPPGRYRLLVWREFRGRFDAAMQEFRLEQDEAGRCVLRSVEEEFYP